MDDVLQIHISIIIVCNTATADVPTLYALVLCFISLKNKNESNPEAIMLNIVASE